MTVEAKDKTLSEVFQAECNHCPYCGKRKRGWRTQNETTLCANCDRKVRGDSGDGQ